MRQCSSKLDLDCLLLNQQKVFSFPLHVQLTHLSTCTYLDRYEEVNNERSQEEKRKNEKFMGNVGFRFD